MTEESIKELADAIYREKVLRARAVTLSKKMGWGAELYGEACSRMRSGIRMQFPSASEAEVELKLRERLDRLARLHEHGIFVRAPRHERRERRCGQGDRCSQ